MDNFNFYSPTEFVFGNDRENECGSYVKNTAEAKCSYTSAAALLKGQDFSAE